MSFNFFSLAFSFSSATFLFVKITIILMISCIKKSSHIRSSSRMFFAETLLSDRCTIILQQGIRVFVWRLNDHFCRQQYLERLKREKVPSFVDFVIAVEFPRDSYINCGCIRVITINILNTKIGDDNVYFDVTTVPMVNTPSSSLSTEQVGLRDVKL